jgi:hypothetical protein
MFPGNRESIGILDDRIKKIPPSIIVQPIKSNGASVFILKYIIQDEVVNGNVPTLSTQNKHFYTENT